MSLTESIVEDAALEWFGEQTRYARTLTPALCLRLSPLRSGSHGEREEDGEVVLVGRLREAILRLNPAIPEEASACASHLSAGMSQAGADRTAVVANFATAQTERRLNS
jgi:hypothetical protein